MAVSNEARKNGKALSHGLWMSCEACGFHSKGNRKPQRVLGRGKTWPDLYFYKFLWDSRWGPFCKGVDFKRDESGVAVRG